MTRSGRLTIAASASSKPPAVVRGRGSTPRPGRGRGTRRASACARSTRRRPARRPRCPPASATALGERRRGVVAPAREDDDERLLGKLAQRARDGGAQQRRLADAARPVEDREPGRDEVGHDDLRLALAPEEEEGVELGVLERVETLVRRGATLMRRPRAAARAARRTRRGRRRARRRRSGARTPRSSALGCGLDRPRAVRDRPVSPDAVHHERGGSSRPSRSRGRGSGSAAGVAASATGNDGSELGAPR